MQNLPSNTYILRAALLVAVVVVLGLLVWQLTHLLVLIFAAVLFGIVLRSLAQLVERFTPIDSPWSLLLAVLVTALLAAVFFFLLGMQIKDQFTRFIEQLPQYIASLGERLGVEDLQGKITERLQNFSGGSGALGTATTYTSVVANALTSFILIIITGIYLAASPQYYFKGFMMLVPRPYAPEIGETMKNIGRALQLWLLGQLVSMVLIGVLITGGLLLIGVPSALALGFMAGIAEFVPFLGPILAAIPAILLAMSEGGTMVWWVLGLYVVVQQLESYVIMPLVQRKAVHLPPVLTILAVVGFGTLFGVPGILLGAPMTVVLLVAVKRLYVRDTLEKPTSVPGEDDDRQPGAESSGQ